MSAANHIAARIKREGPIPFDSYVELALYGEGGFFTTGHGAGRAGRDFVTSPEVGPLFGACVARALHELWARLDTPDPFLVVEAGAGNGRLAREIARAEPEFLAALRYVLVERSAELRTRQRDLLALEPADEALGPFAPAAGDDQPAPAPQSGPVFTSLEDLPALTFDGVVLANELLDNLPFGIAERRAGAWHEVRVGHDGSQFTEVLVPATEDFGDETDGTRMPVPVGMREWFGACGRALRRGFVVLIDYMAETPREDWLRTYRGHDRGTDPLTEPGSQDITADVLHAQLAAAASAAGFVVESTTTQAEWLRALGIDDLVDTGRAVWRDRAHAGDLEALAGRSRVNEAAALTDPAGLGNHRVVVLTKGFAR